MTDLNKKGMLLDAARRQFYLKSHKHLKEHIAKKDNTAAPAPREDSDAALSGRQYSAMNVKECSGTGASHIMCLHMHTGARVRSSTVMM